MAKSSGMIPGSMVPKDPVIPEIALRARIEHMVYVSTNAQLCSFTMCTMQSMSTRDAISCYPAYQHPS